ncbi:MAG: hypothetical protein HFJ43_03970 [Clostridia bacterium]|nr:hypothetical protein [Clostridia bacterium]
MIQETNDICKEVLIILSYFNNDLIEKIPNKVFSKLLELSADSKVHLHIDTKKDLDKQDISEESKDLVSLIYYTFVADKNEKNEIFKSWTDNENIYQENLREKYNIDNIFKNDIRQTSNIDTTTLSSTAIIKHEKENLFYKIKKFIKNILNL